MSELPEKDMISNVVIHIGVLQWIIYDKVLRTIILCSCRVEDPDPIQAIQRDMQHHLPTVLILAMHHFSILYV